MNINDKQNIIKFKSKEHLLKKARVYIESIELFLEERKKAIPLLLKTLKYADPDLKQEIIMLLGGFAKQDVVWPLYRIMIDPDESEEVRHCASIQLSVTASFLKDTQQIIDCLLEDIKNKDPERRRNAAFALGWESNTRAAIPLIELLYDPDIDVQQIAVNALSNLRDDRILSLMLERLEHGHIEQKRCILFNLWRFYSKRDEVISVYLKYMEDSSDTIRFDTLVVFGLVTETADYIPVYLKCLIDKNYRIRELALKRLADLPADRLPALKEDVEALLTDPEAKVKQAAIRLLKKCNLCG